MKKRVLCLLLIMAGLLCVSVAWANELTDDYFDIAVNYFNEKNYTKAMEYLDEVLQIEPGNLGAITLKNKILKSNCNCNCNGKTVMESVNTNGQVQEKEE